MSILIIIFIILLILIFSQKKEKENNTQIITLKNNIEELENNVNSLKEEVKEKKGEQGGMQNSNTTENAEDEQGKNNTTNEANEWQGSTTIKIPELRLVGENYVVNYITKQIPKTKSILNASYIVNSLKKKVVEMEYGTV